MIRKAINIHLLLYQSYINSTNWKFPPSLSWWHEHSSPARNNNSKVFFTDSIRVDSSSKIAVRDILKIKITRNNIFVFQVFCCLSASNPSQCYSVIITSLNELWSKSVFWNDLMRILPKFHSFYLSEQCLFPDLRTCIDFVRLSGTHTSSDHSRNIEH